MRGGRRQREHGDERAEIEQPLHGLVARLVAPVSFSRRRGGV
jgi:hypothetical protein